MMPKFKAALFDMDGTLLCSMRYWRYTSLEYLLRHDVMPTPEQLAEMYTTSSRRMCYEIMQKVDPSVTMREIITELEGYMHRHYLNDVHAKPDVEKYLRQLRSQGIPMIVATGAPREYARDALEKQGILQYFEFVTDGYEFGMDKHVPAYFELMAQKLGVRPQEMCVFEDALYSIKAAKQAGCPIAAIYDGTQQMDWEEIVRISDFHFENYAELIEA